MILNFTQKRLYICKYTTGKVVKVLDKENNLNELDSNTFKFYPGDNKIPDSAAKHLLKHPGIKRRLDLGILVVKQSMTEDLKGEAEKNSKAKKAELEAKKAK